MDQRGRTAVDPSPVDDPAGAAEGTKTARRDFLLKAAAVAFAGAALPLAGLKSVAVAAPAQTSPTRKRSPLPSLHISPRADEDVLLRMQRDMERALAKPIAQRRWGMVIDTRKCVGCSTCTVGCSIENRLPPGVVYRPVIDTEIGTYPNVTRRFLPEPLSTCVETPFRVDVIRPLAPPSLVAA